MDDVSPFDLAANRTRLAILRALVAASREGEEPSFSDLRRRAGVDDSGNFNYHLDQLRGTFVEETDGGYRLSYQGRAVVAPLLAGAYDDYERDPTPLDVDCQFCGAGLSAGYADGVVRVGCPNDHAFTHELPPGSAAERSLEALLELTALSVRTDADHVRRGVCRLCHGTVELSLGSSPAPGIDHVFRGTCDRCGRAYRGPVAMFALTVPEVAEFLRAHGTDPARRPFWEVPFVEAATDVEREPTRVHATFERAGASVTATFDGSGRVATTDYST
ncbi:winged helix-turn-helix domain-containing protein [Halorarius halobius]|uniref:winged helix-turn-helix domain-containing protein n=1 Tax=Halorarius halobius TaxID=2962671 RepID=UPI0020CD33A9|nr:helix-turn-helix domain-containing protein [Halorarius halobius]